MNYKTITKTILCPAAVAFLIVLAIIHADGVSGLRPFLSAESFLTVVMGAFLVTWAAYPFRDIFSRPSADMIEFAASTVMAMGILATIIGVILTLQDAVVGYSSFDAATGISSPIEYAFDYKNVPRRLAYSLSSAFTGLFLSKVVLAPIAWRMRHRGKN